ncbi:hypothetical protein [Marilutibacter spongiae]|uniref:Uncharacterized protein n=1 Tax=Marilutibacter spongiae TaxID=2025720 RepID=A0A7W3TN52_9GAMM|nr:hypothetical protein [Lysobacter spongiae]MBB1061402.1 hypothetical protein [Lysobacter spongiae]
MPALPPFRSRAADTLCRLAWSTLAVFLLVLGLGPWRSADAAWPPLAVMVVVAWPRIARALADARRGER